MTGSGMTVEQAMKALKEATTGMVIDALSMAGIEGGVVGIRPARGFEDVRIVGPAATMLFAPQRPDAPKISVYGAIRDSAPGSVLVMAGRGIDNNFTGDNNGDYAKRQGLIGIVVDGGARDIGGFRKLGMPLFCTGGATRVGVNALPPVGHNVPVQIGGVTVRPGDIVVADEDGVVIVPSEALGTVMDNLKVIAEVEANMEEAIARNAAVEEINAIIAKKKKPQR